MKRVAIGIVIGVVALGWLFLRSFEMEMTNPARPPDPPKGDRVEVVYLVGGVPAATVTYTDETGMTRQVEVDLPGGKLSMVSPGHRFLTALQSPTM